MTYRGFSIAAIVLLAPEAHAQGIAFQPVVASIQNGPSLGVTGVASFDRRYVRIGVVPQFIAVEGFTRYSVPAAVGGGPGGPGALGGVGLGGAGGGVGGAGGGQFLAGMNGVISPGLEPGLLGAPPGYGSTGNPAPAVVPPSTPVAMPAAARASRANATRATPSRILQRGRNPREKAKHPSSAAASLGGIK